MKKSDRNRKIDKPKIEVEKQLTDGHQVYVVFWGNLKKIDLHILCFYFPLQKHFIMKQFVYLNFI